MHRVAHQIEHFGSQPDRRNGLRPVGEDFYDQKFDIKIVPVTLPNPEVDNTEISRILQDKYATTAAKTGNLTRYAFDVFANQIDASPTIFPTADEFVKDYYELARYIDDTRKSNSETQLAIELLDELTSEFRSATPLRLMEGIERSESLFNEPRVAVNITKLWMYGVMKFSDSINLAKVQSAAHDRTAARANRGFKT